jgi:hypothetical protein
MKMSVSSKVAAKILLGVNVILLCGSAFILIVILLEDSPDLYGRVYYATHNIQRFTIFSWVIALALSPVLAITLSSCFGYEVRKKVQWKISIVIMLFTGLPSFVLLGICFAMRGI